MEQEKLKELPIGLQTFEKVINGNYLYVDKTKYVYDLMQNWHLLFLIQAEAIWEVYASIDFKVVF